jgi:hypothetical protein
MGYLHIDNLYKNQTILLFKECYALEKIHGTSAHVYFKKKVHPNDVGPFVAVPSEFELKFFAGGESYENFVRLFDQNALLEKAKDILQDIILFGEAYGGKQQGMSDTYGKQLKFVVFDVKIGESWLSVPKAEELTRHMGLEFVHYDLASTDIETLDRYRDMPSEQAKRNGMGYDKLREGIVLRPLEEFRTNNGERVIAKHKGEKFQERASQPKVGPGRLEVLTEANKIAEEWVTEMRLTHVLDKFPNYDIAQTPDVLKAMFEDIDREAAGEIVVTPDVRKLIGKKTANMFKARIKGALYAKGEEGTK